MNYASLPFIFNITPKIFQHFSQIICQYYFFFFFYYSTFASAMNLTQVLFCHVLYSDHFILAKAQLFNFFVIPLYWGGTTPSRSTPWGAYRSAISCRQCLLLSAFRTTHLLISHIQYLVGRSMVVGNIPMVHTFFNVHQSQTWWHTPQLLS